jgi:hypothetical protein
VHNERAPRRRPSLFEQKEIMRVRHFLKGSTICAFSALVGCAAHTPSITQDEKPTGQEAYLYGRFYIEAKSGKLALDGHQTMGFVIKCASGETYTFRSSNDNALQVIKIAPSMCSLTEIVHTNADGQVRSRKSAPEKLMRDARFDAGKAYYLGDFYAEAATPTRGAYYWNIKAVRNDYNNTSAALKAAYPNLAALPTENRMIGREPPR